MNIETVTPLTDDERDRLRADDDGMPIPEQVYEDLLSILKDDLLDSMTPG